MAPPPSPELTSDVDAAVTAHFSFWNNIEIRIGHLAIKWCNSRSSLCTKPSEWPRSFVSQTPRTLLISLRSQFNFKGTISSLQVKNQIFGDCTLCIVGIPLCRRTFPCKLYYVTIYDWWSHSLYQGHFPVKCTATLSIWLVAALSLWLDLSL